MIPYPPMSPIDRVHRDTLTELRHALPGCAGKPEMLADWVRRHLVMDSLSLAWAPLYTPDGQGGQTIVGVQWVQDGMHVSVQLEPPVFS